MREIWGKLVCETAEEMLHPKRCALVAIDMQNDFVHPDGICAQLGTDISAMLALIPRCETMIADAREFDVPVIHIQNITLPEGRSDSPAWLRLKSRSIGTPEVCIQGTWGAEIIDECKPLAGEPVVVKHRSNAFIGTGLELILRARGVATVVVIGQQTPGCVEATFRDAAHRDFYNVLVEDCVAGLDQKMHEYIVEIARARHDVCTSSQVRTTWQEARESEGVRG